MSIVITCCSVMSAADKARIHQDPEAAYKDYEFVTRLAQAAAMTEGAVSSRWNGLNGRRHTKHTAGGKAGAVHCSAHTVC